MSNSFARSMVALFAATGPLFYILLTIALGLIRDAYDPIRDTQSELGSVDSPVRHWMNFGGFMVLGGSILAFAAAFHLGVARGPRSVSSSRSMASTARVLAIALLVLAGVAMVVVGFFPCDPGCVDVTTTGRLHGLFSAPGAIGLPAAAMLSAYVLQFDPRFGTRFRSATFWLGVLSLASGPVVALELVDDTAGVLQRAGMWMALLWMSAVSWRLLRSPSHRRGI